MRWLPTASISIGLATLSLIACSSGGGKKATGSATQRIQPCIGAPAPATATVAGSPPATATPGGETPTPVLWPVFDVWDIDVTPNGHNQLIIAVNTTGSGTASEFRLSVACQGLLFAEVIDGQACAFPPPPNAPDAMPQCPVASIDLGALNRLSRLTCLAEVVPTEPLDIGSGLCTNPDRADYRLSATINGNGLPLSIAADDCVAETSCLGAFFNINVSATVTPAATASATPTSTPRR